MARQLFAAQGRCKWTQQADFGWSQRVYDLLPRSPRTTRQEEQDTQLWVEQVEQGEDGIERRDQRVKVNGEFLDASSDHLFVLSWQHQFDLTSQARKQYYFIYNYCINLQVIATWCVVPHGRVRTMCAWQPRLPMANPSVLCITTVWSRTARVRIGTTPAWHFRLPNHR